MKPEGQDPLYGTLIAATLGHLMLGVARELYPHRRYFDLVSTEKQTVTEHVQKLLDEARAILGGPQILSPPGKMDFPPQREEEYL